MNNLIRSKIITNYYKRYIIVKIYASFKFYILLEHLLLSQKLDTYLIKYPLLYKSITFNIYVII